jgi:hypothetical protein
LVSATEGALERSEHLAAKEGAHDAYGKKEVLAGAHPARVVGESAAGDDGVHVRMEMELARPGMKHHRDAELGAEALRITPEGEQGLRRAREEHVEDRLARAPRHGAQLRRQREDDVEVVHGQEALDALVDPARLPQLAEPPSQSPTDIPRADNADLHDIRPPSHSEMRAPPAGSRSARREGCIAHEITSILTWAVARKGR